MLFIYVSPLSTVTRVRNRSRESSTPDITEPKLSGNDTNRGGIRLEVWQLVVTLLIVFLLGYLM
jgi:hypothetical protein